MVQPSSVRSDYSRVQIFKHHIRFVISGSPLNPIEMESDLHRGALHPETIDVSRKQNHWHHSARNGDCVQDENSHAIARENDPEVSTNLARSLLESSDSNADHRRALALMKKAAQTNYAPALLHLGLMHVAGFGPCVADPSKAAHYFQAAIDAGNTTALYYLACIVLDGYPGHPPDEARAIELLEKAVCGGRDSDAMILLAKLIHTTGKKNYREDLSWSRAKSLLETAVQLDHPHAIYHLAQLYLNRGDPKQSDKTKAAELFSRAVNEKRDIHSMYNLALLHRDGYDDIAPDVASAFRVLLKAVDIAKDPNAMVELALLYRKGCSQFPRDNKAADHLITQVDNAINLVSNNSVNKGAASALEDAAERCDPCAQFLLGLRYKTGNQPFKRDETKAHELLTMSADNGNSDAMYHLALLVLNQDRPKETDDFQRAINLLHSAVDEGNNVEAINLLADLYTEGFGEFEADISQACQLYNRGMLLGDGRSMNSLGMMHAQGLTSDGEKDIEVAIDMLRRAAVADNANAMYNLGCMLRNRVYGANQATLDEVAGHFQRAVTVDRHVRAMLSLADIWLEGFEGTVDRHEAAALVASAITAGRTDSGILISLAQSVGMSPEENTEDINSWANMFHEALANGKACIFYCIGSLVGQGRPDLYADGMGAARWFQRAIDEGPDENALIALSRLLLNGQNDVPVDETRATQLLNLAVECGNAQAMYMLGLLYTQNCGENDECGGKVIELYGKAAEKGHNGAIVQLARIMRHGLGDVPRNISEAVRLFEQAADNGDASAMVELAELLIAGQPGISEYRERSIDLLEEALSCGAGSEAAILLGRLMEDEDLDRAEDLYELAVDEDDTMGMLLLARLLLKRNDVAYNDDRLLELLTHAVYEAADDTRMGALEQVLSRTIEQPIEIDTRQQLGQAIDSVIYAYERGGHTSAFHTSQSSDDPSSVNMLPDEVHNEVSLPKHR